MKVNQINADKMYTSEEITDYLNVSLRTTQRLLKSGELPSFKIQGQYRIKGIDALNYLSGVRVDINDSLYQEENKDKPSNLISLLEINPVDIRVSVEFAKIIQNDQSDFLDKNKLLREKITLDLGFICPGIKFADEESLQDNEFSILLNGIQVYKDTADSIDDILNKSEKIIRKYAHEIISREEVFVIIEKLRKTYPVIVEDVLSDEISDNKLNIGQLTKILKSLLKEQVSIRNMRTILEAIADTIPFTKNIDEINNRVREALSRQLCNAVANNGLIDVIGLEPELEKYLIDNIKTDIDNSKNIHISPEKSKCIQEKLAEIYKNTNANVIICHQDIRPILRSMIERNFPQIQVLSYREISKEYKLKLADSINC